MKNTIKVLGTIAIAVLVMVTFIACSDPSSNPPPTVYSVGDIGPNGGHVFHDEGNYSKGWRYLEAAPADISGTYRWASLGMEDTLISGSFGTDIGTGRNNTNLILSIDPTAPAASECRKLGGDWFLPSRYELNLMRENLYLNGLGNFIGNRYWSSSQGSISIAWEQRFSDGDPGVTPKNLTFSVRAIRAF